MLESVGRVFADGAIDIEFRRLFGTFDGPAVTSAVAALPTYPFQRKRHWVSGDSQLWPLDHNDGLDAPVQDSSTDGQDPRARPLSSAATESLYVSEWEERALAADDPTLCATDLGHAVVFAETAGYLGLAIATSLAECVGTSFVVVAY
jgi:acyl transferase domain-containing protein